MNCAVCDIKACKNNEENFKIAQVSAELFIPQDPTRIEETMEFARCLGYKKLGLAFCNAL